MTRHSGTRWRRLHTARKARPTAIAPWDASPAKGGRTAASGSPANSCKWDTTYPARAPTSRVAMNGKASESTMSVRAIPNCSPMRALSGTARMMASAIMAPYQRRRSGPILRAPSLSGPSFTSTGCIRA